MLSADMGAARYVMPQRIAATPRQGKRQNTPRTLPASRPTGLARRPKASGDARPTRKPKPASGGVGRPARSNMAPLGGVCENMLAVGWQYQGHLVDDVPRGEGVSPLRVAGLLPG